MKKVIVIGAGIAGLSAAVYAKRSGFDVTILESHDIAGGHCTSWERKGYLFEGAMHWLTGSSDKEPINKVWRCIGAINDDVKFLYNEPYYEFAHKDTVVNVYRDATRTEKHWIDLSPQDEKHIKLLFKSIRKMSKLIMPVFDLKGVKVTNKIKQPLFTLLLPSLVAVKKMRVMSKKFDQDFVDKFAHDGLRELLRMQLRRNGKCWYFVLALGTAHRGSGGSPEGGSRPFIKRIVDTFEGMGGKIRYKSRVDSVLVENGKAVGVLVGDERIDADAVIVTVDLMAMDHLFETPPRSLWLDEMRTCTKPITCTYISLGIDADLSNYPHNYLIRLKRPLAIAQLTYPFAQASNYAGNPVYSPEGKTAMTIVFPGDTYDFWKEAKENGRYAEEKQKVGDEMVALLVEQLPEIEGKIEVVDVATPLTYERYCASWRGSWMTDAADGMHVRAYPAAVDGLSGVYFAGHRLSPPGGMPVAVRSGRKAVQYLCRDTKTLFVAED